MLRELIKKGVLSLLLLCFGMMSFTMPANHFLTGFNATTSFPDGSRPDISFQTFICNEIVDMINPAHADENDFPVRQLNFTYLAAHTQKQAARPFYQYIIPFTKAAPPTFVTETKKVYKPADSSHVLSEYYGFLHLFALF